MIQAETHLQVPRQFLVWAGQTHWGNNTVDGAHHLGFLWSIRYLVHVLVLAFPYSTVWQIYIGYRLIPLYKISVMKTNIGLVYRWHERYLTGIRIVEPGNYWYLVDITRWENFFIPELSFGSISSQYRPDIKTILPRTEDSCMVYRSKWYLTKNYLKYTSIQKNANTLSYVPEWN